MDSQENLDSLKVLLPEETWEALNFERTQFADGSVFDEPFYAVDEDKNSATPGALFRVERVTDPSKYSLPPGTGLSRFTYQSTTFKGDPVPVSAYVLWPYAPRSLPDGYQVVAWAHGTSGLSANCAPSHLKNLWQHYLAPYNLALQGYVVVGTDYAGLGISKKADGTPIPHEYLCHPSAANDVVYSVQAARQAFPELSQSFVVAGHSQGGGAAWAVAQRQAAQPVAGYLGAVAVSPVTDLTKETSPLGAVLPAVLAPMLRDLYPGFDEAELLTDLGRERVALVHRVGGNTATSLALLAADAPLLRDGFRDHPTYRRFQADTANGGRPIGGPLLVLHGERDASLNAGVARAAVEATAAAHPAAHLEFVALPGLAHNAALTGAFWVWQEWIAQRFTGQGTAPGLPARALQPARPDEARQGEPNWWIAPATRFYETP